MYEDKNKWTDEDELEMQNKRFNNFEERENKLTGKYKLDNLGLIAKNKIKEIYNYFKENNVPFSNSKVKDALAYYFAYEINDGYTILKEYIENNEDSKELISKYQNISNSLKSFNIKNDSKKAINTYLKWQITLSFDDLEDINNDIEDINKELKQLHINATIDNKNFITGNKISKGILTQLENQLADELNQVDEITNKKRR